MSRHRVVELLVAVALGVWGSTGAVAWAHGGGGVDDAPASNYRAEIDGFDPGVDGIELRTIDATTRLELDNRSDHEVVVLGYQDEPYLRVTRDGVYQNLNSPATYVNGSLMGGAAPPDGLQISAPPRWELIATGSAVRWHDHRSHWMAPTPPDVLAEPAQQRVIESRWVIPILIDGHRVEATGSISWVPGPNPAPMIVLALVLALIVVAASCTARWKVTTVVASVALLAACALDSIGSWHISSDPVPTKAAALATPLIAAAVLVAGLVLLSSRERDGLALIGGGGAGLALLFGWVSRSYLTMSQIPTTLPSEIARLTVVAALGLGAGLATLTVIRSRHEIAALIQPPRHSSRRAPAKRGSRPRR